MIKHVVLFLCLLSGLPILAMYIDANGVKIQAFACSKDALCKFIAVIDKEDNEFAAYERQFAATLLHNGLDLKNHCIKAGNPTIDHSFESVIEALKSGTLFLRKPDARVLQQREPRLERVQSLISAYLRGDKKYLQNFLSKAADIASSDDAKLELPSRADAEGDRDSNGGEKGAQLATDDAGGTRDGAADSKKEHIDSSSSSSSSGTLKTNVSTTNVDDDKPKKKARLSLFSTRAALVSCTLLLFTGIGLFFWKKFSLRGSGVTDDSKKV